ncbi:RBR-type E3 ubiquitin transferase [[Candida] zeylanoides]
MTDSDAYSEELEFDYDEEDDTFSVESSDAEGEGSPHSSCADLTGYGATQPRPMPKDSGGKSTKELKAVAAAAVSTAQLRVKYKPWKLDEYVAVHFTNKVSRLQQLRLGYCDYDDLLVMLHYKNWQEEAVLDAYYDDPATLFEECGLPPLNRLAKRNIFEVVSNFLCPICCDDDEVETQVYSLTCEHRYCVRCYGKYIIGALHEGTLIPCPECNLVVPHRVVQGFYDAESCVGAKSSASMSSTITSLGSLDISGPSWGTRYESAVDPCCYELLRFAAKRQVESGHRQSAFRWCPAPDCIHLVELLYPDSDLLAAEAKSPQGSLNVPIVQCPDSHEFCYSCSYENHLPCPCWLAKLWIKKCNDDSETANWLDANTQACPKCDASIEKSGGCNHMTCKKCLFDFCWICLSSWDAHGSQFYQCNRFDPKSTSTIKKFQQSKRLSLQRYLFFYKRFAVHETSMRGDKQTLDKVDRRMKVYMNEQSQRGHENRTLSWIDVQFLHDAIRQLTNGRKTLKWTYAFAFYLSQSNFFEIFEQMQDYLNKTVEDLSKIFEQINDKRNRDNSSKLIMKHKQEIINLSNMVGQRQEKLVECAFSGLTSGLLKLESEVVK